METMISGGNTISQPGSVCTMCHSWPCKCIEVGYNIAPVQEDKVDKPAHYTSGGIESIDYMKDNMPLEAFHGFLEGNTKKYLHRWRIKGTPVQDLKKARWYLDRLITELTGDEA